MAASRRLELRRERAGRRRRLPRAQGRARYVRSLRGRRGLAEAALAAPGPRWLDLRRGPERVRANARPRVRAATRRVAIARAARDAAAARRRPEPRIPRVPLAR